MNNDKTNTDADFSDLEDQLNQLVESDDQLKHLDQEALAKMAEKQQREREIIQLGAHSIFAILLSFLAPIFIQFKRLTHKRVKHEE